MITPVLYDEYREQFSSYDKDGVCSIPIWDDLSDDEKKAWARVAAATEQAVKEQISFNW